MRQAQGQCSRIWLNNRTVPYFGSGNYGIRPFFGNLAKSGSCQIFSQIWQMTEQLQNVQLIGEKTNAAYLSSGVFTIFTVRRYALHGICDSNSVCLSVTLADCVHMVQPTIMISSPYGSPIILVSGDIMFIPKFEGGHPERGHWMRVGFVRIGDFRPISRRISETVRDTTKVTINH